MSSRVLEVKVGHEYRHNFLDDLESFFWVIFLASAAHLDNDSAKPTEDAQYMINGLDRMDLRDLGIWKSALLTKCAKKSGAKMKSMLRSFRNTWASDPIFVNTLVPFGSYLDSIDLDSDESSELSPATVFSTIVDIILAQLK
jgi:hypothetical protein